MLIFIYKLGSLKKKVVILLSDDNPLNEICQLGCLFDSNLLFFCIKGQEATLKKCYLFLMLYD